MLTIALALSQATSAQKQFANIYTTDIDNFWQAYDRIATTKDSAQQYQYLHQFFLDKGTPGLKAMMKVRDYTAKEYVDAINRYPRFWQSIRPNMLKAKQFSADIAANVQKLKVLYPALKPAPVYFTVGVFRSGGTTLDGMVLIGSESTLTDEHTIMDEFPANFNTVQFAKTNPINNVVFTNVHEYVHTQQKTTTADNLLGQCVLEGVAEFLAEKATGKISQLPAISYGKTHAERIRQVFAGQLFNATEGFWLYSNMSNQFNMRDLGYYVGHAICEKYYNRASDKKQAIKEMIELDCNDQAALSRFVDQSHYFTRPVEELKDAYEKLRPTVVSMAPFNNHATQVSPAITQLTLIFSRPMNKRGRGFELGSLGMNSLLKIKRFVSFSEDGRSATFEVELKPNQHYQVTASERFRDINDVSMQPYLIDFTTAAQ